MELEAALRGDITRFQIFPASLWDNRNSVIDDVLGSFCICDFSTIIVFS